MYHVLHGNGGKTLCMETSWAKGHNFGFDNFESFVKHCTSMVAELDGHELTVYDDKLEPVAYLNLSLVGSFHRNGHGLCVAVSAVRQDLEGDLKLAKAITQAVRLQARENDCSWYERSKHINPNVIQTIIKEI